jgi:hypothetical protein
MARLAKGSGDMGLCSAEPEKRECRCVRIDKYGKVDDGGLHFASIGHRDLLNT